MRRKNPQNKLRCISSDSGNSSNSSDTSGPDGPQRIRFEGHALGECIDSTMAALHIIPDVYQRTRKIHQVLPQPDGKKTIWPISESNLKGLVSKYIEYFTIKPTKNGFEENPITPPKDVIDAIYTAGYWAKLPYLRAITTHPVVRRDGSVQSRPGYDPKTQVFSTHTEKIDIHPFTKEEAYHARAQLLELVDEFPFVDISADVWLGTILTPLVRPWCGPAPFFIVTSSTPSAGKGRLIDISSIISCGGGGIEATALPPNTEEWQKCLISWGLSCPEIIYFDNVFSGSVISSPVLDMALTKDVFSGRILGQSKNVDIELLTTWMASGNNISTKGDTSRRTLICRIEPNMEFPECREFRIPNILAYTKKHRNNYLSLACGIVAGWLASRGPIPSPPLGSFEGWSYAVRGAILWSGGADIADALASRVLEGDDSATVHRALLAEWFKSIDKPVTAKDILEICENATDLYHGNMADIIAEFCPGNGPNRFGTIKALSFRLRGIEGRTRNIMISGDSVKMAVKRVPGSAPIKWTVDKIE